MGAHYFSVTDPERDRPLTPESDTEEVGFSSRTGQRLIDILPTGSSTLAHLARIPRSRLRAIKGFGRKSIAEVDAALAAVGLSLAEEPPQEARERTPVLPRLSREEALALSDHLNRAPLPAKCPSHPEALRRARWEVNAALDRWWMDVTTPQPAPLVK